MASEKVTAMIEEIKGLTVLELSELVHALEEEFGVSAAAAVAGGEHCQCHDTGQQQGGQFCKLLHRYTSFLWARNARLLSYTISITGFFPARKRYSR